MSTGTTELKVTDGYYVGPIRTPRNRASTAFRTETGQQGSAGRNIHDDATAQSLGFRGGTIAGSIHLDQFPPLLVAAFGERWFEAGSISLNFKNATVDNEPVVAFVAVPEDASQVPARMERTDGLLVAEGTAGLEETEPTHLHAIDLRPSPPEDLRMLAGIGPGSPIEARQFSVDAAAQRERIVGGVMTEPLSWYTEASPWGPPIVPPSAIVQLIRNGRHDFGPHIADAVGLFGAIELRFANGPLRCDTDYSVSGEVVAVGASPKTEYAWYDSAASDEAGNVVVSMRMQLRWMKGSSPLYAEEG